MNNTLKNSIILALVVVVAVLLLVVLPKPENNSENGGNQNGNQAINVTDFESCVQAGNPVQESFPRKCTANGLSYTEDTSENAEVVLETPVRESVVASPLVVKGKAKGTWYFEANLPVTLKDSNGKVLAQKGAQAKGEWMTTDYVDFEVTLEFAQPTTEFGVLIIEKDNASGLPENDLSFAIPVRFK